MSSRSDEYRDTESKAVQDLVTEFLAVDLWGIRSGCGMVVRITGVFGGMFVAAVFDSGISTIASSERGLVRVSRYGCSVRFDL